VRNIRVLKGTENKLGGGRQLVRGRTEVVARSGVGDYRQA
jgi:hypothetical protein